MYDSAVTKSSNEFVPTLFPTCAHAVEYTLNNDFICSEFNNDQWAISIGQHLNSHNYAKAMRKPSKSCAVEILLLIKQFY